MNFSVIHATLGRPQTAALMRELWLSRAENPGEVEYLFGLHSFDAESMALLSQFPHAVTDKRGAGPNLESCAAISAGTILVQAQDDITPPHGWDAKLLAKITELNAPAFVCVSDGHRTDFLHVTSIMTRAYMERKARGDCDGCGFGHPGYFSMFWDTENSIRAYRDGVAIDARELVFYHDHPVFVPGKAWDETYEIENAAEHYTNGSALFKSRNPV